jgi:hypothetical protein
MTSTHKRIPMAVLAALLSLSGGASALSAQQQNDSPAPAQQTESSSQTADQQQDTNSTPNDSQHRPPGPVGGVEEYRLKGLGLGRSFLIPSLSIRELYDTNTTNAATASTRVADTVTSISGSLSLEWLKRNSALDLDYQTGGFLYNTQTQSNGVVQQLSVTDKFYFRRWNILVGENFSYLPDASIGLGGLANGIGGGLGGGGGLPGVGGGVTNWNPFLLPGQSIQSNNIARLVSSSVVQLQYTLGARSSLDGTLSVGFVHFPDNNLLNSRQISPRIGYNRALTARDTVVLGYTAAIFNFSGGSSGFTSHTIRIGYRRIVTGHLFATVEGGPVISTFGTPVGMTTVPGGTTRISWGFRTKLDYLMRRSSLRVDYGHRLTEGSGLLLGADADTVTVLYVRDLTRVWSGGLTGSFAHNSGLTQTLGTTAQNNATQFNTWNVGVNVSRPIGRYSRFELRYFVLRQTSNTTVCAGSLTCGAVALGQNISVAFNWSTRPINLE